MNKCHLNTELSSHEGTRCQFNGSSAIIKLGIDVHQDYYVVVKQEGGTNPKPAQRFQKHVFLHWVAKLKEEGAEVHAVYEACGFGFSLQLQVPEWIKELLLNTQPILLALQEKIRALTAQLQAAAEPKQPRGLGLLSSVVMDREVGNLGSVQKSAASGQLHRLVSGRVQQRRHPGAKLCDQ